MRTPANHTPMQFTPGKKGKKIKDSTARLYDPNTLGPYFRGVGAKPMSQAEKMWTTMSVESKRRSDNMMKWWNSDEYKKNVGEYSKNVQ